VGGLARRRRLSHFLARGVGTGLAARPAGRQRDQRGAAQYADRRLRLRCCRRRRRRARELRQRVRIASTREHAGDGTVGIWNLEFGIWNACREFQIPNSEFQIPNSYSALRPSLIASMNSMTTLPTRSEGSINSTPDRYTTSC